MYGFGKKKKIIKRKYIDKVLKKIEENKEILFFDERFCCIGIVCIFIVISRKVRVK